jgi:hypothetical protein
MSLRPPLFACALRNHEVISRTKVPEILCISRGKQALGGSNLMVIDEIATLPTVARNDKRGLRHSLLCFARVENGCSGRAKLCEETGSIN